MIAHLRRPHRLLWVLVVAGLVQTAYTTTIARQMPDARQMSGIPRPDAQLATGTVTVRVARGSFANPVDSLTVELTGSSGSTQATTNAEGRAEFAGIAAGVELKAVAVVAGERLESQSFVMPSAGGVRLALIAADPSAAASPSAPSAPGGTTAPTAAAPAQPGTVVLGEDSRFVFEMGEDGLSVFYVLQIRNAAAHPVQPQPPLAFELPAEARGAGLLQGSSPQAKVSGRRVDITGPFQPGDTMVQVAYSVPFGKAEMVIEQPLPITLMHVAVVAQKLGDMQLTSPQMPEQQTMPANGNVYIAGRGGMVQAGEVLRFAFSGLPHHSTWVRDMVLVVAFLILAGGAWSSIGAGASGGGEHAPRRELEARRDALFDELTALEAAHRDTPGDAAQYAARRRDLVSALEQVYSALDEEVALRRAG